MAEVVFLKTSSGSTPSRKILLASGAVGNSNLKLAANGLVGSRHFIGVSAMSSQGATGVATRSTPEDLEFEEQERQFQHLLPFDLAPYIGQFVASRNGEIVDADNDLAALTQRFFDQYGDVPVYITKVGGGLEVVIDTPFFD